MSENHQPEKSELGPVQTFFAVVGYLLFAIVGGLVSLFILGVFGAFLKGIFGR